LLTVPEPPGVAVSVTGAPLVKLVPLVLRLIVAGFEPPPPPPPETNSIESRLPT
jgi:hypothetical protein